MAILSIVIPVLEDRAAVERLFGQISPDRDVELIVVDGGRDLGLDALVSQRGDAQLLRTPPGRGRQMNAGATAAHGEWLLFLHADSTLPHHWRSTLEQHASGVSGGWFRFAIDDPAWQARVIERAVRWRVRWLRLPYGDQGFFVRRDVFTAMGGYRDLPLMEDVDFIRRLVKRGPVAELPIALGTSPRRWHRNGWFRRSGRNLMLLSLYFFGVSTERLSRWYR